MPQDKLHLPGLFEKPHRRLNPLTGEYILVSPQRATRPWQGKVESLPAQTRPQYDPDCYLCPGNRRANAETNPAYPAVFVFDNDFPALLQDPSPAGSLDQGLFKASPARGTNRVICYSPRHDLTLATMDIPAIEQVIGGWIDQYVELGKEYQWVQVFQNQGELMGASNPHPHGQVWAIDALPNEPFKEDEHQQAYLHQHGSGLLGDYLRLELEQGERIVLEGEHWVVLVPFWAVWPFETIVLPRRAIRRMPELGADEITDLAEIMKSLLSGYDRLFDTPFPYSMGWHGAPYNGQDNAHWQLHAHFYPPLLRSATVKKFMVGYEMLAEAQRDLTPEQAARALIDVS